MSCAPVRPGRQQPLVGRCRLLVSPAIAEDPSTQIRDFFLFGLQAESDAGALDCIVATAAVVKRFAQLTIDQGSLVIGDISTSEIDTACLEVARRSCADHGLTNFPNVAQLRDTLAARPSLTFVSIAGLQPQKGIGAIRYPL